MRDADSILVFGEGEVKNEFRKRLKKDNLGDRIVDVLTSDKMIDHHIVAKVQEYFDKMIDHQIAAKVQESFPANQLVRKEN